MRSKDAAELRFRVLEAYVGWTPDDAGRVRGVSALLDPFLPGIVEDFYAEIERHDETRRVITGGQEQIERLKGTLLGWLRELLSGRDDDEYLMGRWRVGYRHVEIGLDQVFTNAALSRIRAGLTSSLTAVWEGDFRSFSATAQSLNRRLDLDLAIIEAAYQTEYKERNQRIERLATIGQVAGGVAHELRNPLNVIKTSVYYLLNAKAATDEKRGEHLRRIERHVDLADGVITALSNFARLPPPEARSIDLAACLRDVLEANPMPASVKVALELPEDTPRVSADDRQLQIVFGNLLRNARDAMPGGGELVVRVTEAASAVEVSVADTGVGIPADELSRIMEPLFTTKAKGLGLGLAIARSILDKNGGTLRVVSQVGRGSTFVVRLVQAPPDVDPPGQGTPSPVIR